MTKKVVIANECNECGNPGIVIQRITYESFRKRSYPESKMYKLGSPGQAGVVAWLLQKAVSCAMTFDYEKNTPRVQLVAI